MNSFEIRQKFLKFFEKNSHTIVPSSSLIPAQDPTLLFTNAGMNQFKDVFLGKEKRSYKKATSIQKCVRAGGKHNDLDQVGFTSKHLTFFEMMGNFSFGDYFKNEVIKYAWDFLTKEMNLPAEKLCVSVYKTDDEAFEIWNKKIGVPQEKIYRFGEEENFWQMGDTGPCGPCSEIHMDYGVEVGCKTKHCDPSCDCSRFVEIWNLVFMQYNRQTDGTLKPLEKTGIDTGMGFERLCMIMQNKSSIYQTDLFKTLIDKLEALTKKSYAKSDEKIKAAFHVLSDHIRSSSLLIADGCTPSNEGRGYVLRKIIRRAALFAQKLSDDLMLFPKLATEFIKFMSPIYPELKTNESLIKELITNEIDRFATNLLQGQNILEKYLTLSETQKTHTLSGKQVFKLYDTYGFPPELTKLIAQEKNFSVDINGFEEEMKKQQKQSGKKEIKGKETIKIPEGIETKFVGYEALESKSKILFLQKNKNFAWIVTEQSPFYVESGGQVGDAGWISINEKSYPVIQLDKTDKAIIAKIKLDDEPFEAKKGDLAHCIVDYYTRKNTEKNHTATHLMQAALMQIVGKQIKQAGSAVNDKHLRYDFTYHKSLTPEQIDKVELLVNQKIQETIKLNVLHTTLEKAKEVGAVAFFGEKYNPENVRVIQIPGFSVELCGGTHVENTGKIGCFKILSETALSAGVRRIFAVTGPEAVKLLQSNFHTIKQLSEQFKTKPEQIFQAVQKQQQNLEQVLKQNKQLKTQHLKTQIPVWVNQIEQINDLPFLFLTLENVDIDELKKICTDLEKKKPGFFFLTSSKTETPSRINFLGYLSKGLEKKIDLKEFNLFLKEKLDLKGGGSANLIQGGGSKVNNIKTKIIGWLK